MRWHDFCWLDSVFVFGFFAIKLVFGCCCCFQWQPIELGVSNLMSNKCKKRDFSKFYYKLPIKPHWNVNNFSISDLIEVKWNRQAFLPKTISATRSISCLLNSSEYTRFTYRFVSSTGTDNFTLERTFHFFLQQRKKVVHSAILR